MKKINLRNGGEVLVDDKDFDFLSTFKWTKLNERVNSYASTFIEGVAIKMHWLLIQVEKPFVVDHADGNGLNNQRSNLRKANPSQNCQNRNKISNKCSSKFKGVHLRKDKGTWMARIQIDRSKRIYLGDFKSQKDAALAYDCAAREHFGEFAKINIQGGAS